LWTIDVRVIPTVLVLAISGVRLTLCDSIVSHLNALLCILIRDANKNRSGLSSSEGRHRVEPFGSRWRTFEAGNRRHWIKGFGSSI